MYEDACISCMQRNNCFLLIQALNRFILPAAMETISVQGVDHASIRSSNHDI